ncbi:hypothetical protein [Neorhodopirellula lusitana]|uniref:hypothetical protein n=1 Tax=Neorhodopirellula lusitana TaxID=445327 RepID=UPI00384BECE4
MQQIVIDWDDEQLRLVIGESDGARTRLRDAAILPVGKDGPITALKEWIASRPAAKYDCLIALGRDRAELRQMDFPPVPVEELPDMVRFQAIRQFAAAGDSATVDFITTQVDDNSIKAIVSATGPNHLNPIRKNVEAFGWTLKRIALRPIAAAALYRIYRDKLPARSQSGATLALIDLVSDEAEIVLLRDDKVVFVRSVRLPKEMPARTNALAGEIRRSMMACGAAGTNCNVVMWGTADRHAVEIQRLGDRLAEQQTKPCQTDLIDPFELVGADPAAKDSVGQTVGRLAPLVGLLAAHAKHADELIDFENPRKTIEVQTDRRKIAAMIGIPVAVAAGLIWMLMSTLSQLDDQIDQQAAANAEMKDKSKAAEEMIARTDRVDQFLNGDVNWLEELQRLASRMPGADQLMLQEISATADSREGGGRLVVTGRVTSPDVIVELESAMRDDAHQVTGDKVTQLATQDAYRWQMTQTISVNADAVQTERYARMNPTQSSPDQDSSSQPDSDAASANESGSKEATL